MSHDRCPQEHHAVAWIQAELSAAEARHFAKHLVSCEACRSFLRDADSLLQELRRDGAPRPMTEIAPPSRATTSRLSRLLPVAAAAVLLVALLSRSLEHGQHLAAPNAEATQLAWLEQNLSRAGTWPAEATIGLRAQKIGLHSIALMALARGAATTPTAERLDRVARAAQWLVTRQNDDGSWALSGGLGQGLSDFDQVVGTRALLDSWALLGDQGLRAAALSALEHIAGPAQARQRPALGAHQAWRNATLARARDLGLSSRGTPAGPAPVDGWDALAFHSVDAPLAHRAELSPAPLISAALAVLHGAEL